MPDFTWDESPWFADRLTINSVTIENNVTAIGNNAFSYCENMTSVTMPNSITSIGDSAFLVCTGLPTILIPDQVTTIGDFVFYGCKSLETITIPASVSAIGTLAFDECNSLTAIDVHADNNDFLSDDGVLYDKGKTRLILYPEQKSGTTFEIPNTVTIIEKATFNKSSLTTITIPDAVTEIKYAAFWCCRNLTGIILPNSLKTIGAEVFYYCESLTTITIPNTVTEMGVNVFYGCNNLKSVSLPATLKEIPDYTFHNCSSLTSIEIPNSITAIGYKAFAACTGLEEVTVGWDTPLSIPDDTFDEVNTSAVTLKVPAGAKTRYIAADVWKTFTIVENDFSDNDVVVPNPLKAFVADGILSITGLRAGQPLYIYNVNGQLIHSRLVKTTEEHIPIVQNGIFIIVSGEKRLKIFLSKL
jgi:hypothetical protein